MTALLNTLWIGGPLSELERLCLYTWLHHGHPVNLYTYDAPRNAPTGVELRDAREVLPESRIFRYAEDSHSAYEKMPGGYGAFANLFRYHLLYRVGGWWLDTDVALLRRLDFDDPCVFAPEHADLLNNAVLKMPHHSHLAAHLVARAEAAGERQRFAETGPPLLTELANNLGLHGYAHPRERFYPHHWRRWQTPFRPDTGPPYGAHTIHFWNEILRRNRFDKNAPWHPTSQIGRLAIGTGYTSSYAAEAGSQEMEAGQTLPRESVSPTPNSQLPTPK